MTMWHPGELVADVRQTVVNELGDEGIDDAVVALAPLVACRNQLDVPQECELMADRRHGEIEDMREIAYAELLVGERVHDPEPQRIGERQEHFDRGRRRLFGR